MTRALGVVLAVAAGLCAALLLASGPTVHVGGEARRCPGVIASSEDGAPGIGGDGRAFRQACAARQRDWSELAALAALVSVAAGTGARFAGRDEDDTVAAVPVAATD